MGYTFIIGDAKPKFHKDHFPYLEACWEVDVVELDEAPTFPNDEMTGKSNLRRPSYSTWSDFCRAAGIYDLFFDTDHNLYGGHPGCRGLTKEMVAEISASLVSMKAKAILPPGFIQVRPPEQWDYKGHEERYDSYLARLIWLEWWARWALNNCETPAISNS